jgi:hypothetical protein
MEGHETPLKAIEEHGEYGTLLKAIKYLGGPWRAMEGMEGHGGP